MFMRAFAPMLLLALTACHPNHVPQTTADTFVSDGMPIELALRSSTGRAIDLADYRGAPVLIAMLGTYDTASQAALEMLGRYARHHPDVFVVAILAQQGADLLVEPFALAAGERFPIAYDPTSALLEGRTGLGPVESVPSFVTLDARGAFAAKHNGYVSERQLAILVDRAVAQAPVTQVVAPPLLGRPR